MKGNFKFKKVLTLVLAVMMLVGAMPVSLLAQDKHIVYDNDKEIRKEDYINKNTEGLAVVPAKVEAGKTSKELVDNPPPPAVYTLRTDYRTQKGEKYIISYQPYIASVGEKATPEEQAKIKQTIKLPELAGYRRPIYDKVHIVDYKTVKSQAKNGTMTKDNGERYDETNDFKYKAISNNIKVKHVFQDINDITKYTNPDGTITDSQAKYVENYAQGNKGTDGSASEKINIQKGNTGSTMQVSPLEEKERPGFVPESENINMQVPDDAKNFKLEYRYNRAHYAVDFDTKEGSLISARTCYFGQVIPKLDSEPTKRGSDFLGWMPSHDLEGYFNNDKTLSKFKKGEIIADKKGNPILDLSNKIYKKDASGNFEYEDLKDPATGATITDPATGAAKKSDKIKIVDSEDKIKLIMPALSLGADEDSREKLTFTAKWQDKTHADYAVQFWAEKADHADNATTEEKYEYIGTHVNKDQPVKVLNANRELVPFRPDLSKESIKGLPFPDLDQARLDKIWNGPLTADGYTGAKNGDAWFNRQEHLLLNKFFVYNKKLTDEQNKDPEKPTMINKVSPTGQTVYNIYFDRQVYDLYFTKSNARSDEETFFPSIYKPDGNPGGKQVGGPGNLYTYKARFNELMLKWPNDAMQTKGFTPGKQSYGWGPNYTEPAWPTFLDTPPYRLNADEFLDMAEYESKAGYTKKIEKGDGTVIDVLNDSRYKDKPYTVLSFGIMQGNASIPHHMDLWMDGFKTGETIIRYDLYRTKADTDDPKYGHKYPKMQGFKAKEGTQRTKLSDENDLEDLNDERDEITPIPKKQVTDIYGFKHPLGQIQLIPAFFNNADEYGDPVHGNPFKTNGYLRFKYTRDKYPLRFNYDPSKTKGDDEFSNKDQLETFYEFPLKVLSPDLVPDATPREEREYFKDNPKNLLDDANNLYKLGLHNLLQVDASGKPKEFDIKKTAKTLNKSTGKIESKEEIIGKTYRVRRPEYLSDQMVFKGWALDPAGTKLASKNKKEIMPNHAVNLYAKWGEPDEKWKVVIDTDGGRINPIDAEDLTTDKKTIEEGDAGSTIIKKEYPVKGYEDPGLSKEDNKFIKDKEEKEGKQVFTVIQRQKLRKLENPTRKGYDFMGWEIVRFKKDTSGKYTNEEDKTYRQEYNVPELYTFGNDVVSPIYLKAVWVPNNRIDIDVLHYFVDRNYEQKSKPKKDTLEDKRVGDMVAATGDKQDDEFLLIPKDELPRKESDGTELEGKLQGKVKEIYKEYNARVGQNNSFFQTFRVGAEKVKDTQDPNKMIDNPDNVFKFFYRPFRKREYTVNYVDERGKKEIEKFFTDLKLKNADAETSGITNKKEKEAKLLEINTYNKAAYEAKKAELEKLLAKYRIISEEEVSNGNRHYDARNYRAIPGWTLVGAPQQQLFFDVNEETNEFLGINGTGSDKLIFYYKDVRVIETKKDDKTPDGYVRVTFKAEEGGSFGKDAQSNEIKELYYDVIKGLKSDLLPVPKELKKGETKEEGKYCITPYDGKKFVKWDNAPLLNKDTVINEGHEFTAYFDWAGAAAKDMFITEAFKDPNGTWTNDFAPTIDKLKDQIVWKVKNETSGEIEDKPLPEGTKVEIVKDDETTLLTNDEVYELVKEAKAADTDQTVRTVSVKAKLTFKDGKAPQVLTINIKIYKNVYEALNKEGDKPLFLKEAEKGELKDVTGDYVMVTVKPNKDFDARDTKVYYVNPKAWVEIPEVKTDGDTRFTKWKADKDAQNDNGAFDFGKRHMFTEDTVITPEGADDVVEQTDPTKKPDVPGTYVKVIVDKTANAELGVDGKQTQTFWVNPSVDVTIPVAEPKGKTNQEVEIPNFGKKKVNYIFKEWQKVKTGEADDSLADVNPVEKIELTSHKYTDKVTVIEAAYKKSIQAGKIEEPIKTKKLDTPQGKEITKDDLIKQITPQEGKEIKSIEVVTRPDSSKPEEQKAEVIVTYTDGTNQGTNDNPVVIPIEVHKNIVPADANGAKPKEALENYVKVILKAGEGGTFKDTLTNEFIYYVSPEVEVDMTEAAGKIQKKADTGYIVNGEKWTNKDNKSLKGTFIDQETVFEFTFDKSKDIVEKTDDPNQVIPEGYVTVTFKTEDANKGKLQGDKEEVVYFVNPDAGIKIGKTATADNKTIVIPTVTAKDGYSFTGKWQEAINETDPIKNDRTHVAIFEKVEKKVILTYSAGEGTGTVASTTVKAGTKIRLANASGLTKANSVFKGWKIDDTIYQAGDIITLNENKTATAQWSAATHTVRFDTKGGSDVEDQTVEYGKTLTAPTEPKLEGKIFTGWKEKGKEDEAAYFDFSSAITEDKILLAQWQDPVQEIGKNATVESQFIKVTFDKGEHGELYINDQKQASPLTYKVYKDYTLDQAKAKGLVVPKVIADTYYKLLAANEGWDKELALNGQDITFTAQYELTGDVIPVDPDKTDEEVKNEKPEGMVLVEFKVPEDKAYMLGNTKFYVTKGKEVDIETPRVHRLELPNGEHNDYVFRGWDLSKLNNEWKFNSDTTLSDGAKVKPTISVRIPSANAKNVVITNMTEGATGYLRVTRGTAKPVVIESTKRGRRNIFSLATLEGSALNEGDLVEVYAKKDGVESDLREFIVSK